MELTLSYALEQDALDPLASFRDEFVIEDADTIYMDGNSLGRLPKRTVARLQRALAEEWGKRVVRGWNEGWYDLPQRLGAKIASLIGAQPDEVIVADSTSVNFYKLVRAVLQARPSRYQIVTETVNFPSDSYILQGIVGRPHPLDAPRRLLSATGDVAQHPRLGASPLSDSERGVNARGYYLTCVSSEDGITIPTEKVVAAIDRTDCALVTLTHTAFKSGYVYDMRAITQAAHEAGALVLWDLSHSVGSVPVELNECDADLAVGCTYKYLNGGPGAPAFLYVRRDLQDKLWNPIQGWFGQKNQFDMSLEYAPAAGVTRFLVGTPPILSTLAIEVGVDLMLEAGMDRLREKSVKQSEYLIALWEGWLKPFGVTLNSPREARWRGSHVSLGHADALRIDRALIEEMNVIPDFRYPDNIRFGIAPIYTSFVDIYYAMERMRRVLEDKLYEKYPTERPVVT